MKISDKELSAFICYAARERAFDASIEAAERYGRANDHASSIAELRELNKNMLFRASAYDIPMRERWL